MNNHRFTDLDRVRFGGRLGTVLMALEGMAFIALDCGPTYVLKGKELSLLDWVPSKLDILLASQREHDNPDSTAGAWVPEEGDFVEFIAAEEGHPRAGCMPYPKGIITDVQKIISEDSIKVATFSVRWILPAPWRSDTFCAGDQDIRFIAHRRSQ